MWCAGWPIMAPRNQSLFLERQSYRRRRTIDAARLVPLLGLILIFLPLLWGRTGAEIKTSNALIYLFSVWVVLVILARLVAWRLRKTAAHADVFAKADDQGSH